MYRSIPSNGDRLLIVHPPNTPAHAAICYHSYMLDDRHHQTPFFEQNDPDVQIMLFSCGKQLINLPLCQLLTTKEPVFDKCDTQVGALVSQLPQTWLSCCEIFSCRGSISLHANSLRVWPHRQDCDHAHRPGVTSSVIKFWLRSILFFFITHSIRQYRSAAACIGILSVKCVFNCCLCDSEMRRLTHWAP